MNKKLLLLIATCLLSIVASAQVKHFDIKIGDFDNLIVYDNINVTYESDTLRAGTAVFDCPQNIADGLIFRNNTHGRLTIQVATDLLGTPNLPTLHVYSSELAVVENGGDSTVTLSHVRSQKSLKAILSDNGRINLDDAEVRDLELMLITGKGIISASGYCNKLRTRLLGKGTIDALRVSAQYINVNMTGTGTIDVDAEGAELNVRGSGTGRVNYLGTPSKLKVRKLGPLKVMQLDP